MKKLLLLLSLSFFSCGEIENEKLNSNIKKHFERLNDVAVTTNLYNKETVAVNTSINYLGNIVSAIGNCTTDFIELDPNTTYSFSGAKGLGNYNYLYNSNRSKIRSLGAIKAGTFTTSNNEVYVKFTVGDSEAGTGSDRGLLQINKGATVDYLQPYNYTRCPNWTDDYPNNAVFVVIHAGQSNALGACSNRIGGSYLSERQATNKILRWNSATNTFVNQNLSISGNHGIDLFLQKKLYDWNRPLYYINTAVSNTIISKHLPPTGSVYLTANTAVTTAINQLISQGKRPYIWYVYGQGEADSTQLRLTNAYVHGTLTEQSYDIAINQTKINLANTGAITFYPTINFEMDINQDHRNYNGYGQEAQVVWNIINEIRPVEITAPLTQ